MTRRRSPSPDLQNTDLHDAVGMRLARHDYRYTNGRRRLVDVIAAAGQPVTLPDILVAAPELAPSSVYRNLDVLERSGVVDRIASGGDHAYFEFAEPLLSHHHHLICIDCGAIEDVRLGDDVEALVDRSLAEAASRAGFAPLRHSLDLRGYCSRCR
ncbi:MAG: Fur family transcriptional regulator [Acidimicrobiaceae bacterium]|nr:Fur family transcriptional regulator [Acidimicrobiaceae bacterium]